MYVLYEAVERLKAAMVNKNSRHRPNDSITVHMGLSSVFQKLVLAFQDISVFIYRQKLVMHVTLMASTGLCTCIYSIQVIVDL